MNGVYFAPKRPRGLDFENRGGPIMKHKNLLFVSLLVLGLLAMFSAVRTSSAGDKGTSYVKIATINPPATNSFDISWVDSASGTYYLADRTATPGTGRVDVIDAEHDTFLYSVSGFVGSQGRNLSGPNGIVVIHKRGESGAGEGQDRLELWAGDGVAPGADSTVKVVDLETRSIVATIHNGGNHRADELAYDPVDKIILIANDADVPFPFVTFISAESRTVLGKISYPQSTGGLEQPVWDPQRHLFYMSVPSTVANPNGEVDEIDPIAMKVTRVFPITTVPLCGPAGLALLPGQRLVVSCGVVLSAKTGATLATIAGVAADEIWYNPGDNRVYFGHEPVYVVDAETYKVVATFDAGSTHSIAADSENNHVFVPVSGPGTNVGVTVWTADEDQDSDR
jgi:hypothetical protein